MGKITSYPEISVLDESSIFLLDGDHNTRKIYGKKLMQALAELSDDVQLHRNTYGGRNLGTSITAEQHAQIAAGTFYGMLVGDYWIISGVTWRIADFDYWLKCGDTESTTHHAVIVPDAALYSAKMNDTNITDGAYVGSLMRTTNLESAKTTIKAAFGEDHILTHREYLQNATKDGYESGGAWMDASIELMSEIMVYGSNIFHNMIHGTSFPNQYTVNKTQLALFRMDPTKITTRANWWLRDVASAASFCGVAGCGYANYYNASSSNGVRPAFAIK